MPKFLLKNFAVADGRVYRLNVADDKITKLSPKQAAARPNFNVLMANGDPTSFESKFEALETAAARPLAEILKRQSLAFLSQAQRIAIARFVAAQSFRTEAYRLGFQSGLINSDIGTAIGSMLTDIDQLAGLLALRKWVLLIAKEGGNPFYLGDNPVVLQNTERPGEAGELGLDMDGIEAFLPLSPLCALYMICPKIGGEIIGGYRNALRIVVAELAGIELGDFDVKSAASIARRTLQSAGQLYRAITNGLALEASAENIENLNYLQCAWASSGIFSNHADFTFAMRVFRDNPQYREVMRVRLHAIPAPIPIPPIPGTQY